MAVSSLGSALAIIMMVGVAVGRPPWPRGLVQTGSVHRGSGIVLFGSKPLSTLNAQPPELKRSLMTQAQGAAVS